MVSIGQGSKRYYAIVGVQGLCAAYFLWDVLVDIGGGEDQPDGRFQIYTEFVVAIGLIAGLGMGIMLVRRLMEQRHKTEAQLKIAAGAFAEVVEAQFAEWGLTAAERDVALFTLKGYSVAEVADFRGKSEGTIKAQNNAIYRKAGVSGRTQLICQFLEDLVDDPVVRL